MKSHESLAEWDIEIASHIGRQQIWELHGNLSKLLSLRNVVHGFESLCSSLYGLSFEIRTPATDEIWPGCILRLVSFA
jgi:Zn-dependent oligopeptidase